MLKSEIRKYIKIEKRQFSDTQLAGLSLDIMQRLLAHPRIIASNTIMMYYSLPDEVNTHSTIESLRKSGKRILLPVVVDDKNMELRQYDGLTSLYKGTFNINEPKGIAFKNLREIDVAVIPGMAFDFNNNRLGRGKGYYDRFLPSIPHAYKIGICFDFQKITSIPIEATDIRMDEVL